MSNSASAMQALLESDTTLPAPPRPGELVNGKVIDLKNNKILVEISGVYTGIIAGRETIDGLGTAKQLSVGDEVAAFVVEDENSEGLYVLSLRKAGRERAWDHLTTLTKSGEPIEVRIKEANKGGLMTEVSGIRAFIPVSQLAPEHYPRVNGANAGEILRRLGSYIGQKFIVRVITVDRDADKLILSEKEAISVKRTVAIKKLSVGKIVKGKVSGIVSFGVFLLFDDCLEGLIHLSEITWGHVTDPAVYARIGEEKEAVVIGIDADKISLSMKRLTPDPWLELVKDYKVGDVVTGTVNKITPFGAFLTLKENLNGLIHISEIIQREDAEKPEVNLDVDDVVQAKIITIDPEEHRLGLSLKALGGTASEPKKKVAKAKKVEETKDDDEAEEKEEEKPKKKKTAKKE